MKVRVNELIGRSSFSYSSDDFKNVPKSGTFFFCTIKEAKYLQDAQLGVVSYDRRAFDVVNWLPMIHSDALNWPGSKYMHAGQLSLSEVGMFCRSNSGDKRWAGQLIRDEYDLALIHDRVMCDELMFIAPCMSISSEWRLWMIEGRCIASTSYSNEFCRYDKSSKQFSVDDVVKFAEELAESFEPNDMYVMDIANSNGCLKVVEYNAFSTSGFYEVDSNLLIKKTLEYLES